MSDESITLNLQERETLRKGLNKLRAGGTVPAVIHDHGKPSLHVMGDYLKMSKAYSRAGKHHPVELKIGGKQRLALIKNVDLDPRKHQLRHVVFQAIKQNEKVSAEIPVLLEGEEIPAEKKGLLVLTQLDVIQVEAFPKDLPDQFVVDATKLEEVGDRLHVSDIKIPEGVTILTEAEASLAVVEMPKDQAAEADASAKALAEEQGAPAEGDEAPAEETGEEPGQEAEGESEDKPAESL